MNKFMKAKFRALWTLKGAFQLASMKFAYKGWQFGNCHLIDYHNIDVYVGTFFGTSCKRSYANQLTG